MGGVPEFKNTPIEDIKTTTATLRTTFAGHKTRPLEFRLKQLQKLYWALKDNSEAVTEACKLDLGKSATETYVTELGWCMNDIVFVYNNLKKWAKDEAAADISLTNRPLSPKIRKDPLGCVLVIGAYNFPIQLSLGPFIGAIAAGCTAVLKPSEAAPNAAMVLQKICEASLDPTAYAVLQGGVPETTALLDERWDKIFYTGGATVGKIIAKKAAETLTPVTLELGGRNPAFITKNADLALAARRLLWGKTMNAGQVCVSQNYTMIDESVLDSFISELKAGMSEFFPEGAKASEDYGRIVNQRHFDRLKGMLDQTKGKVLIGGETDAETLFIAPTVVQVSSVDDALMVDETFGPFLTILPVKDLDSAIRIANEVSVTPLGLYTFGSKAENARILSEVRSGGASVNDSFFHASVPTLPFGGVGESGQGAYRGRASFDCFTHRRSIVSTPGWMERILASRYPPFKGTNKLSMVKFATDLKPSFGRA